MGRDIDKIEKFCCFSEPVKYDPPHISVVKDLNLENFSKKGIELDFKKKKHFMLEETQDFVEIDYKNRYRQPINNLPNMVFRVGQHGEFEYQTKKISSDFRKTEILLN